MTSAREPSPKQQLAIFIRRFTPPIAKRARAALAILRKRLPGAFELVYDNAYALVIGFGPTERPSEALFSLAIYPQKLSLCFLRGARLHDPDGLLAGGGHQVRFIRLDDDATLRRHSVRALMLAAVVDAGVTFEGTLRGRTILRAISKKRRPRRP
jgi:hypothetical protein